MKPVLIDSTFWSNISSAWTGSLSDEQRIRIDHIVFQNVEKIDQELQEHGTVTSIRSAIDEILDIDDEDDDDEI